MKHFISEEEFKSMLLNIKEGHKLAIKYVDSDGDLGALIFYCIVPFRYKVILYTYPQTSADVGMIQEDIDNGWDEAIHDVWTDITDTCGYRLFTEDKYTKGRLKKVLLNNGLQGKNENELYLEVPGHLLSPTGKLVTQVFYDKHIDVVGVYWVDKDGEEDSMSLSALVEPLQDEILRRVLVPIIG